MNKATRKKVNNLSKYVGHKIIRKKETNNIGDFSYTSTPIILTGFTAKGEMKYKFAENTFEHDIFGGEERILPIDFTDGNWILFNRIKKGQKTKLSKWSGKCAWRISPTSIIGDRSFMKGTWNNEAPTVIWATKHHVCIEYNDCILKGERSILDYRYANPNAWKLAD